MTQAIIDYLLNVKNAPGEPQGRRYVDEMGDRVKTSPPPAEVVAEMCLLIDALHAEVAQLRNDLQVQTLNREAAEEELRGLYAACRILWTRGGE
jgi:hypothetical protein